MRFLAPFQEKVRRLVLPRDWPSPLHRKCSRLNCFYPNYPQPFPGVHACGAISKSGKSCPGVFHITPKQAKDADEYLRELSLKRGQEIRRARYKIEEMEEIRRQRVRQERILIKRIKDEIRETEAVARKLQRLNNVNHATPSSTTSTKHSYGSQDLACNLGLEKQNFSSPVGGRHRHPQKGHDQISMAHNHERREHSTGTLERRGALRKDALQSRQRASSRGNRNAIYLGNGSLEPVDHCVRPLPPLPMMSDAQTVPPTPNTRFSTVAPRRW